MKKKGQLTEDNISQEYESILNLLWDGNAPSISDTPESTNILKKPMEIDSLSKNMISSLDEKMQPMAMALLEAAKQAGINLTITQGYRSKSQQSALYEQGRTAPGPVVTNAKPGYSKHNFGVAIDVAPINEHGKPHWPNDEELWDKIGEIGESVGLKWGGRSASFKDSQH